MTSRQTLIDESPLTPVALLEARACIEYRVSTYYCCRCQILQPPPFHPVRPVRPEISPLAEDALILSRSCVSFSSPSLFGLLQRQLWLQFGLFLS